MPRSNIRRKVVYLSDANPPAERGREWFSMTVHPDGQRTLRAHCEIDVGVAADRTVVRDINYTVDSAFRPLDGFVRLHQDGHFLGSGWFHVTDRLGTARWSLSTRSGYSQY